MKRLFVLLTLLLAAVAGPARRMQAAPRETSENPRDLVAQFRGMDSRPEILGFRSKGYSVASGYPTTTHYQGIVRRPGAGVPYFFVSRSGMGDGDEGNILVVRMGSRRTDGERLRSNRLAKGKKVWETAPDSDDRVVHHWEPGWQHVGSLAIVGDVLAVALEDPIGANKAHEGAVWFYDVSSPDAPRRLSRLDVSYTGHKVGVVGFTRLPDRHFLLAVTWGDSSRVLYYRSKETTLLSDTAGWTLIRDWDAEDVRGAGAEWPTGSTSFQSLSMHSSGGRVFVIGTRNTKETTPLLPGTDQAVLYEIEGWNGGLVPLTVTQLRDQAFSAFAHGDGIVPTAFVYNGNFLAGACTHVTPAGELLMYAVEHYTHGPSTSVRFVEWRHQHIASLEGKLLAPRGQLVLPDFLPAGTHGIHMTNLTTYAMRPWIQLYDEDDFGGTRVTIDYPDFDRDDYNDLRKLDGSVDGFNDRTSSMRWWAPPGWRVRLHDADNFGGGEPTYTLNCNGTIQSIANLSAKPYEFDNGDQINIDETRLTSIRFLPPEFETYEDIVRGIKVEWFVFSTTPGAATIEGRSLARAQLQLHTPGALVTVTGRLTGRNGEQASFRKSVRIVNTPPQITAFRVNQIPNGIVQASVSVADPGNPGDVLVKIDWGDGTSTLGTPPAGGTFGAQHQYRDSDSNRPLFNEYTLIATVTDPEGAIDSETFGETDSAFLPGTAASQNVRVQWRNPGPTGDSDGDGMPDEWEHVTFGGIAAMATDDSDGDGTPDLDEYREGTSPVDDGDRLRFEVRRLDRDVEIRYESRKVAQSYNGVTKRMYILEMSPSLNGGSWTLLREAVGNDEVQTFRQPSDRDGSRFYRLRTELK
jgi:hypothetical protein